MRPEKLDHVALFVSDPDRVVAMVCARLSRIRWPSRGFHVNREVDAENSKAIFVCGPDDVELEYIEHKPSFGLA